MNKQPVIALCLASTLFTGCAAGLNSVQTQEYKTWESKGLLVKEKDPGTAAALGLLPGGGSFYTGEIGYGIVNLLMWPLSIMWDPVSGSNAAKTQNYYATKSYVEKNQTGDLKTLEDKLIMKKITNEEYVRMKREIESGAAGMK